MNVNDEEMISSITKKVLEQLREQGSLGLQYKGAPYAGADTTSARDTDNAAAWQNGQKPYGYGQNPDNLANRSYDSLNIKELGPADVGQYKDEIVVGLAPLFGEDEQRTIGNLSHKQILKEIAAGIEEEGLKTRFIKVYSTSDVAFVALTAAKYSGSGIGIGLQSKGTAVIHQKDLYPLTNLELFSQAPVITPEMYRKIGKNAARYAKGQVPEPVKVINDYMVRPKFQAKAAIMHIKETEHVAQQPPVLVEVDLR